MVFADKKMCQVLQLLLWRPGRRICSSSYGDLYSGHFYFGPKNVLDILLNALCAQLSIKCTSVHDKINSLSIFKSPSPSGRFYECLICIYFYGLYLLYFIFTALCLSCGHCPFSQLSLNCSEKCFVIIYIMNSCFFLMATCDPSCFQLLKILFLII